jgi:predicted unusual protein kinase regulating ubiquinone biosynthesis (AarF/ABC1/UbiB family)
MVAEFKASILRELDYRQEAANLATLRENLSRYRRIIVPQAIKDYSTSRVLTMEYIHGAKVTALSPIARGEVDGRRIAEQLFHAYLKQVLVDGFFHADPHPGNIFITDDGKHVALLDLGMVARISPRMQEKLLQLLLAISEGHSDDAASIALRIGDTQEDFDARTFNLRVKTLVEATQNTTVQKLEVGRLMLEVTRVSGECGIRLPSELTMLGKTLLNLDQIVRKLDPEFDPNEFIRSRAPGLMRQRMKKSGSTGSIFTGLLETKDFIERLPKRLNTILDRVADNELSIKVHAIDERRLIAGLEKIANRITLGLILASLVVGAAMLMSVPTTFKIFGYPGIAMIFFLAAAAGGIALAVSILMYDAKHPEK